LTLTLPLPFRASRALANGNPLLGEPCVALEVAGLDLDEDVRDAWRRRVERVAAHLGWPAPRIGTTSATERTTLCFTAPADRLQTAREVNEWALCAVVVERDPSHWSALRDALSAAVLAAFAADPERHCVAAEIEECAALQRFERLAQAEAQALQTA
jgi:hypothetical protein